MAIHRICKGVLRRSITIIILFIVYLLNPIIVIKVGRINNKVIGHLAMETDFSLHQVNKDYNKRVLCIWYFASKSSSNFYLQELISKKLTIVPETIFAPVFEVIKRFSIFHRNIIPYYDFSTGTMYPGAKKISTSYWSELADTPGLNSFYTPHIEKYEILKRNLEISNTQIACVHVRDSEFKTAEIVDNSKILNVRPNYDAIRLREFRNSEIENFLPSASLFNRYGIDFIRVGKVMKKISDINPYNFIDYSASKFQGEENDLLLIMNSKFFVGTLSGLGEVARWARVPVFQIDVGEFTYFSSAFTGCVKSVPVVLPKVIKSRETDEILSINEVKKLRILQLNIRDFHDYINSPRCPIILSTNSSEVIGKTIELGINYLDKKTEGNSSTDRFFRLGQDIFSNFYNLPNNGKYPAISPWWPNALKD